jgi:hypothetical protein
VAATAFAGRERPRSLVPSTRFLRRKQYAGR